MRDIPNVAIEDLGEDDNPYHSLCSAPGWKVGGHIRWGLMDPFPQPCPTCETETEPLLTIATFEWGEQWWIPQQDKEIDYSDVNYQGAAPTGVNVGRGYSMIILTCPASYDHPHVVLMQ